MADLLFHLLSFLHQEKKYRMHGMDLTNFSEDAFVLAVILLYFWWNFYSKILNDKLRGTNCFISRQLFKFLSALCFLASETFLQVIGDTVGLLKSTVSRTIWEVSAALIQKGNQFSLISFPGTMLYTPVTWIRGSF